MGQIQVNGGDISTGMTKHEQKRQRCRNASYSGLKEDLIVRVDSL